MKIGFIGTGNIASAVVQGLCTAEPRPERVVLSPRNAEKAAALATQFAEAEIAADNQTVVDACDWVMLAVRPPIAREVVSALRFRPGQTVVSLIAAVSLDELKALVAPADTIIRAVPLPAVANHVGPTAIFPAHAEVEALFNRIGVAVSVDDEYRYNALCTVTATAAAQYALLGRMADWLAAKGVDGQDAARYLAAMGQALAADAAAKIDHGFDALIDEVSTPGGMNEQVLGTFRGAGWLEPLEPALEAILDRHEGKA